MFSQKNLLRDIFYTVLILTVSFLMSLWLYSAFSAPSLVPLVFVLGVFLVSLCTNGYVYGIVAALTSVLAVNFAFTFPFFEFNFTIPENAVSALVMIIVTVATSALTTQIKHQEVLKAEMEKEKMRANLLRAISHDLRTPLTAIYGASSTILENDAQLSDEDKNQMLLGIKEDSQWLIRMVENLLSVTKIDNSNVKLIKTSTVLEELVDSSLAKFKKRYQNQPVELTIPEEFVTVSADAILIEQVLVNLLENAVQHATGMTRLQLQIKTYDNEAVFEVIDNGCGVDKERLKSIFSGYVTSGIQTADAGKHGMGIGLSVCATIIRAHGGRIYAQNEPGGGMRFGFTLELEENLDE